MGVFNVRVNGNNSLDGSVQPRLHGQMHSDSSISPSPRRVNGIVATNGVGLLCFRELCLGNPNPSVPKVPNTGFSERDRESLKSSRKWPTLHSRYYNQRSRL